MQELLLGRLTRNTAEVQVLDGGVFEVKRLGSYGTHPIVVAGSADPAHRSTFRFGQNDIHRALP